MRREPLRILYTREVIDERVKELAGQVAGVYREKPFVVAITLKGAFIFAADLIRHLPEPIDVVFVRSASYGHSTSPERPPAVDLPTDVDWKGKHVLVVEDIVDTGRTIDAIRGAIASRGAESVRTCAFLDKPARREVPVEIEFVGFTLADDAFVVGYGLDFGGRWRNLPYVGVMGDRASG